MQRRDFLKIGAIGSIGLVAGNAGLLSWAPRAEAVHLPVNLDIISGHVKMIDGTNVYMFSYSGVGAHGTKAMQFPGPTIICQEGDRVNVALNNTLATDSSFVVGGTAIKEHVLAGTTLGFSFDAPPAGTYLYYDYLNNGVNRVMGLHGALVVMPFGLKNRSFVGGPTFVRQYKWLLATVDPLWNKAVQTNGDNYVTALAGMADSFTPKYFTINGYSFDQTHNPDTDLYGAVGEPALVRMLNAGMAVLSLHYHGNHVAICSTNRENYPVNQKKKDAVSLFPLDVRDAVNPFKRPPDIPEGEFSLGLNLAQHPQRYPMHDHTELTQTAGGGLYPHGMHCAVVIGQPPLEESELTKGVANL